MHKIIIGRIFRIIYCSHRACKYLCYKLEILKGNKANKSHIEAKVIRFTLTALCSKQEILSTDSRSFQATQYR